MNKMVDEWLKKFKPQGVRPELLAATADISIDTLRIGLRGANWSEETISKLQHAMHKIESDLSSKPNNAA
jgi:hypothetical protein